eukprot:Pgem_evm1s16927
MGISVVEDHNNDVVIKTQSERNNSKLRKLGVGISRDGYYNVNEKGCIVSSSVEYSEEQRQARQTQLQEQIFREQQQQQQQAQKKQQSELQNSLQSVENSPHNIPKSVGRKHNKAGNSDDVTPGCFGSNAIDVDFDCKNDMYTSFGVYIG